MTRSHIGPAKLAIKTTINGNSILVGNGSFRIRICSTRKRRSVFISTSAKEFPFPFLFRKNSVSIFIFSFRFHFSAENLESFRSTFIPIQMHRDLPMARMHFQILPHGIFL
jgi:hypothetical protein